MRGRKLLGIGAGLALVAGLTIGGLSGVSAAAPAPLARGGHVSAVARPEARGGAARGLSPATTCMTPGSGNYQADCNSSGNPVNETTIAYDGATYVAGANDYNSYNGNADFGYYTSTDAKTWTDNGPLDLFAQGTYHAAGDPGLAIDTAGVSYYSGIYFDYFDCTIGGLELARQNPADGTWTYYQIAANSDAQFQDKPAVMQDGTNVFVSWTQYGSCTGIGVTSPIKVAIFPDGTSSVPPTKLLSVPGSTYSQGSAMTSDGQGGFWITWEEFPSSDATVGSIMLDHFKMHGGWGQPRTISPPGFTDLPSPLPGFVFRDNSFPMIALADGKPRVVWCSYDTHVGRTYLYSGGKASIVSKTGGDQFFPSVAVDANGQLAISWSQTDDSGRASYDRYLSYLGAVSKVSTASSFPNNDPIFLGQFIGDYDSMVANSTAHPIWTDVRGPSFAENAMLYSP